MFENAIEAGSPADVAEYIPNPGTSCCVAVVAAPINPAICPVA
jgi:hypothetical protein